MLFFYSAIASILITISLIFTSQSAIPVIFALLFLPVTAYFVSEFFKQIRSKQVDPPIIKKGEILAMTIIFILLVGSGIYNVSKKPDIDSISTQPLIFKVNSTPTSTQSPKKMIQIVITDGSESVNIRRSPTVYSEKVGEARDGDSFTYINDKEGWFELEMASGSGYISGKYIKE